MKKINIVILIMVLCCNAFAQKQIRFNNKAITINGDLVATHQYIKDDGTNNGTKEVYSYYDEDIKVLQVTELDTDKRNAISSIFIYTININLLNKAYTYVMERTNTGFKEPTIHVAKIALTDGKVINVKSMNWGDTEWTTTTDPIAQVYFNTKADAEKLVTEISK